MFDGVDYSFEDLTVGQTASFGIDMTEDFMDAFTSLSGNTSPIHADEAYARTHGFDAKIAHGMLGGMLTSRFIGMYLPGRNSLCLSQSLTYLKPIYAGMSLSVQGAILSKSEATRTVELSTEIWNESECLVRGSARVKIL